MTEATVRRGRPPGTSARELELAALELFRRQGFEETTVEQISAAVGVSGRTFFRYFDSKVAVLWHSFDEEVGRLREAFASAADDVPLMDAVRQVVIEVNGHRSADLAELRDRMQLLRSEPALQASATQYYDDWERAVSEYAGRRLGEPPDALVPLAVGRTTLATCRAAFDRWLEEGGELVDHLDTALDALARGFAAPPLSGSLRRRRRPPG
jgi:mycofactocin system transcriptional regulator